MQVVLLLPELIVKLPFVISLLNYCGDESFEGREGGQGEGQRRGGEMRGGGGGERGERDRSIDRRVTVI